MMARMTPVSLHFSDVPTGWKKKIFTDKQQLATGFACSSRTVSPDEHCYRLICASCTQFHVPLGTQAFQLPQCLVSSCIILDFQTENTIREFDTWDGHHCRTPWCCKLHASHRSQRKHPQRYNEPNSLVTSTTSCTNLLHTRTIQCKECVLRSLRPRLLRLTSKHHCRIDMQTEQRSSLWTYQFPHRLPHQTNQAPHVLARIH